MAEGALPSISAAEASRRGLVVIGRFAYDAGPFLGEHPGGEEALARWLGRDATAAFARIVDHEEGAAAAALARLRVAAVLPAEAASTSEPRRPAAAEAGATVYILLTAVVAAALAAVIVFLR